ncbi:MAG: N-acetyl-alpha-D-glucosaminyl L-malate synthase BshA [Flavobacteriales bacterium]|nr:N-acetyl-alpha-D-glucosaminyl L-malate synthase BshA [Flavobacteriales bacterium]
MKIGIVCYPTFGGSGVVATELGKALAARGHQIHFISYSQPVKLDRFTPNLYYHEVRVQDYPLFDYAPYELALTSKLVDVAQYEQLDLMHVHYAIPHASAAFMARQILADKGIRLPYITTLHGTDITLVGKDRSYEPVITFAINHSDGVTTVSESLKQDTGKFFDVRRPIEVIPNFVCLDEYDTSLIPAMKKQFAPGGQKVLVHTSNFRPVKRVKDVVKIFHKVREVMDAKLMLIGDGPDKAEVEELCRKLDICDDVIMMGKHKNVEPLLMAGDLFLLTSEFESFGLAALEAMAAYLPVISSNTAGIPEVNEDGVSGYLCPVGDVDMMAEKAIYILSDEARLEKFRKGARKRAEMFDLHAILPMYEALYKGLLEKAGV